MNIWQRTKGSNTYINRQYNFRNSATVQSLSGFLGKCAKHVVWRRTVLTVALQQEKRL